MKSTWDTRILPVEPTTVLLTLAGQAEAERIEAAVDSYRIEKRCDGRTWALYDADGELVAVTLYKKGAEEVKRRLTA